MANLIPVGSGTSDWVDVTVSDTPKALHVTTGQPVSTLPGLGGIEIAHKAASGNRTILASLPAEQVPAMGVLAAPGTYSVRRSHGLLGVEVEG